MQYKNNYSINNNITVEQKVPTSPPEQTLYLAVISNVSSFMSICSDSEGED